MVTLKEGINKIRDLANSNINEVDWGTGTTAEAVNDTGLETEISSIEVSSTNTVADATLQIVGVLPSTSGNGSTITENVVRFSDGTDFTRRVFTGVTKTAGKELHTIQTTTFTRG